MNKLVINTQYLENYGDSKEPYMKFKGGNTYVMYNVGNLDKNEIATHVARVKPYITTDLVKSNGGSEEYILEAKLAPHSAHSCEDWETVTQFSFTGSTVNFMKVTNNREDGWMKKEILEQTETWVGSTESDSGREEYFSEYLMEDGDLVSHEELGEWFAFNAPIESKIERNITF